MQGTRDFFMWEAEWCGRKKNVFWSPNVWRTALFFYLLNELFGNLFIIMNLTLLIYKNKKLVSFLPGFSTGRIMLDYKWAGTIKQSTQIGCSSHWPSLILHGDSTFRVHITWPILLFYTVIWVSDQLSSF